jgi:mRNA-degrading endonuclease RelE of RelBE toxin-antitoxin system
MDLVVEKAAAKVLKRIQPKLAAAMLERMNVIAADPMASRANVKSLAGRRDSYRLRQGDWRIIYFVDRKEQRVHVLNVDTRGDVYK